MVPVEGPDRLPPKAEIMWPGAASNPFAAPVRASGYNSLSPPLALRRLSSFTNHTTDLRMPRSNHPLCSLVSVTRVALAALVAALPASLSAQDSAAPQIITQDLTNFYRALDMARGQDSASRVRIFRTVYIDAGTPGLSDWTVTRLADLGALIPELAKVGWVMPELERAYLAPESDSAHVRLMRVAAPLAAAEGARQIAAATARLPRFFDGIRARVLVLDTSTTFRMAASDGLRRLQALYPEAKLPPVYLLVGRLTSGGTATARGMLIGVEMSSRASETPIVELSETERSTVVGRSPAEITRLIVHEAVHTMQQPTSGGTLLAAVLSEGMADFMANLAVGESGIVDSGYTRYGRANERRLKREFRQALARKEGTERWLYNPGRKDNHGATDLGYFVGFRICQAFYERASDKHVALSRLLSGQDPESVLRESRYLDSVPRTQNGTSLRRRNASR